MNSDTLLLQMNVPCIDICSVFTEHFQYIGVYIKCRRYRTNNARKEIRNHNPDENTRTKQTKKEQDWQTNRQRRTPTKNLE